MYTVDPFAPKHGGAISRFLSAALATAVFRCWPLLLFYTAWATAISVINHAGIAKLSFQPTLLTVFGTVLGFIVSYRTTASFERYNEGRRLWSQIILGSRTLARTIWFHVPEMHPVPAGQTMSEEERRARVLIEKKTVINLIEAFGVAVKHYLRGEEGVYYVDLYHLVKHLPAYALPAGLPSLVDVNSMDNASTRSPHRRRGDSIVTPSLVSGVENGGSRSPVSPTFPQGLPPPATAGIGRKVSLQLPPSHRDNVRTRHAEKTNKGDIIAETDEKGEKYHLLDLFPLSLLVGFLTKRGKEVKGKKAARIRAKLRSRVVTHNLPLEISLYLSSYIAALQDRGVVPPPTATNLLNALTTLVDALTGLERILTTPIPFSYRVHLWSVALVYNFFLPLQIYPTLGLLTIPATFVASFIFFGFLVAGEEIENPFGYDKNDLNLDHFTHNIIRNELLAITALPAPHVENWAFSQYNDQIFSKEDRATPNEWIHRGLGPIQTALATI
ncbi:UPF0187-domain-containing protein [Epithele typhae]|uniref:UPF0187-domain-containing protein n=1 Tax=Epithele typhae TaxID=378194 RepID=UPI002007FE05|nr:UPF0187-domain-containing protein [Epithele typhae]KAH9919467.1 UPF0187-domain-containing protein [Epithele typhae]